VRWVRWITRGVLWTVTAVLVLAVAGILILTRTGPGVRFVVEEAVGRLEGSIQGSISYEEVASPDLLGGAEIHGLEIRDDEGRLFVRSDTLEAGYSILRLLTGDIVVHDIRAAGLSVVLERLPGQEALNAVRIFASGPPQPDSARTREGPNRRILLQGVEIDRGSVDIRLPVSDSDELPDGAYTMEAPGGDRLLRRYSFRDLQARLPRISISAPDQEGERIQVASLATTAEIQAEPVRIDGLRGRVARIGSRLTVDGADLRLPNSSARGDVAVDWGGEGVVASGNLDVDPLALGELQWLVPQLPEARAVGSLGFRLAPEATILELEEAVVTTDSSRIRGGGRIQVSPEVRFTGLSLDLDPLAAGELDRWLPEPLPYRGRFEGSVELDGELGELAVGGEVDLLGQEPGFSTARFSGVLGIDGGLEAAGFRLDVDPLDFSLVESFLPDRSFTGTGSLVLDVDGSLSRGLELALDLEHGASGLTRSRIEGAGSVRTDSADVYLTFDGEFDPVDVGVLRQIVPGTDFSGEVEGPVRLSGSLGALRVEADLEAAQGGLTLDARFDARDLASGYQVDAIVDDFALSELMGSLPSPTTLTGSLSARGRGLDRESLEGEVDLRLRGSRMARLIVDTAEARLRVGGGEVRLDTLEARTNLARLSGTGALGLDAEHPDAVLRILFRNDSLETVRPLLLGDTVIAADTLSPLEREVLSVGGVDPDTLPTEAAVALDGRLRGEMAIRGWLDDFTANGTASVEEVLYGTNFVRGADLAFTATRLPGFDGAMEGVLQVDSVSWGGRSLAGARAEVEYTRPAGRVLLELQRHDAEDYRARASFEADSVRGSLQLEELALRFDQVLWTLQDSASFDWDPGGLRVRDFTLVRPDDREMRVHADGVLPREGEAEFDLEIRRMRLERIFGLAQTEEAVTGLMDLDLRIRGTAGRPRASGFVGVDSLRFRNIGFTRIEGDVSYDDTRVSGTLEAWREDLLAARLEGSYPAELSLRDLEASIPSDPVNLRVVVDSFPTAVLSTVVEAMQDVEGTVTGQMEFAGTPGELDPSGSFRLQGGAFSLPGLGIRPTGVDGDLSLARDATAEVDVRARSAGGMQIQGTLDLATLTNPGFDLSISASGFQAIDRRDLEGRFGGDLSLGGTYQQPVITGTARVDQGVLRIEEFARGTEVIDLSDPRFFDVVDTSFVAQPDIDVSQNPFLQNLRVEVTLSVQRNTWLRSRSMNVEMGGDLVVNWNRNTGDLVLTGQLNAIRGTYSLYGRQFQVQEGTVEFVGTPGLNPNLSIQAVTRLRTTRDETLNVIATVTGTLAEPQVSLTSDAQTPIAEPDLVSYLFFGQPSFTLGSAQQAVVQGALGGLSSLAFGALGSAVQQAGIPLDYVSVTQETNFDASASTSGGIGSTFATTQVEIGQYLTDNIFVSAVVQPLDQPGTADQADNPWGVRAEWQIGDVWTVEGFYEDRFTRGQGVTFGSFDRELAKIYGLFLYREWGY